MDQSSYWITSTKQSNNLSWEERAFAEDYSCIWPPRSYSCTFCRREFRSAQALGGHMNVHRRDRARLRSASSPNTDQEASLNNETLLPAVVAVPAPAPGVKSYNLYSSMVNPNPNPNNKSDPKLKTRPDHDLSLNETLLLPHDDCLPSPGEIIPLKSNRSDNRESFVVSSVNYNRGVLRKENSPLTNSSVQLIRDLMPSKNIIVVSSENEPRSSKKRGLPVTGESTDEDEDVVMISKRRKVDLIGSPIVVNSPSSCNQERLEIGLLALRPGPDEELDLELRLGGMPKIKQVM